MRMISLLLIIVFAYFSCQPAASETIGTSSETTTLVTAETKAIPPNVLQEMDITFWQTLPFATFWTYLVERQLAGYLTPGVAANWQIILSVSAALSLGNAWVHSRKEMEIDAKTKIEMKGKT